MEKEKSNQFIDISHLMESNLQNGSKYIFQITNNQNSSEEIIKILQSKLASYNDETTYLKIIYGILNEMLFKENMRIETCFQILYAINRDNFQLFLDRFLETLNNVKIPYEKYDKIYSIFEKIMHINNESVVQIFIIICRNIFPGIKLLYSIIEPSNVDYKENYFLKFLLFIKSKIDFILKHNINCNLPGIVFIKILRLLSETHMYHQIYRHNNFNELNEDNNNEQHPISREVLKDISNEYKKLAFNENIKQLISEIIDNESYILTELYKKAKNNIYKIGRELIRLLVQMGKSNIEIINTIIKDITKEGNENNISIANILSMPYEGEGFNFYALVNIPPLMESMIIFLLTKVKKNSGYNFYLHWIYREFDMENCIGNTLLVDITRFIMTCYIFYKKNVCIPEKIPRPFILSYILKKTTNRNISIEIKQAIFMDLILYDKNRDDVSLIEPSIACIILNMKDYPEISEELIEFLDYYVRLFDKNNTQNGLKSIYEGIKMCEEKGYYYNMAKAISESKMEDKYKKKMINMMNNNYQNIPSNVIKINSNIINNKLNNNDDNIRNNFNVISPTIKNDDGNFIFNNINTDNNNFNSISQKMNSELKNNKNNTKNIVFNDDNNISKFMSDKKLKKEVKQKITISKDFQCCLTESTLNSFIKTRKSTSFNKLLCELCNYVTKTFGRLDGAENKLRCFDSKFKALSIGFANFYIEIFKDELELQRFDNKDEKEYKYIYLFDFTVANQKDNNIFYLLSFLINKIIEIYPKFLLHLMYYVLEKNYIEFFYKLNDHIDKVIKEKLLLFFKQCEDNFLIHILNYFFMNGAVAKFKKLFFDDINLVYNIIKYCDMYSINIINMSLIDGNYILIDKIFLELYKQSINFTFQEKNIFWNLVYAQKNIPSLKLADFLTISVELSNKLLAKFKNEEINIKYFDEFFLRIIDSINILFNIEINRDIRAEGKAVENLAERLIIIFDFDSIFKSYIYKILICFLKNYYDSIKPRSDMFKLLIAKFTSLNITKKEKLKPFLKVIKFFCEIQEEVINKTSKNEGINENDYCLFFEDGQTGLKEMVNKINNMEKGL